MTQINDGRILIVDVLRVLAIVLVLFSHILITIDQSGNELNQLSFGIYPFIWKTWGQFGVTLFLVISGFSLEYSYGQKNIRFKRFYWKRITRIYPIYYISLLIGLVIQIAFAYSGYFFHDKIAIAFPAFGAVDIILILTGCTVFVGKWGGPLIWSSWFIGVIMAMYLFYPVISWGCRKSPWVCITLLLFISVISRTLLEGSALFSGNPMEWFPPNRLFEFGSGIFLAALIQHDHLRSFNRLFQRIPWLTSLSALSFPLFLIHDPLRRLIVIGHNYTASFTIGIAVFLVLSLLLSKMALMIDQRIQRALNGSNSIAE